MSNYHSSRLKSRLIGLVFLTAIVLLCNQLHSQEGFKFSNNSGEFISGVRSYMKLDGFNVYEGSMTLVHELDTVWKSGVYYNSEKNLIVDITQRMADKGLLNSTDFYYYFKILNHVPYSFVDHASIFNYLTYTSKQLDLNDNKAFKGFLEYSFWFFERNILNRYSSVKWYLRDSVFRFPNDSDFVLAVGEGTLVCATPNDSFTIYNTSGTFSKEDMMWIGKGGQTTWKYYDIDEDMVYAMLSDYSISMKTGEYTAENVLFYNLFSSEEPLVGQLQDKVYANKRSKNSKYPMFKSYGEDDVVTGVFDNISLVGCGGIQGSGLCTSSDGSYYARMTIDYNDTIRAKLLAKSFIITEDKLKADNVIVTIYIDNDSIIHNGLSLLYNNTTRELMMYNPNKVMGNGPFCDTYHNLNIFSEAMLWNLDDNKIRFHKVLSQFTDSRAYIKSINFFRNADWDRLKGIDDYSPLTLVAQYMMTFQTDNVDLNLFANYLKRNIEQIVSMVMRLVENGYVTYDYQNMIARPTENYYLTMDARYGKIDYDVIRLDSYTTDNQPNMVLDFTNNDLIVNGVTNVIVSDAKNVIIVPYGKSVVVKKDLDIEFSGKMMAGLFEFYTHSSYFNYSDFAIELPTIDSLVLYVKKNDSDNSVSDYMRVKNVIKNVSGTIYIDDNTNKSGLVNNANYPIFDCVKDSQIDFEKTSFILPPFKIDSLFTFNMADFNLKGIVRSGVFKDFDEELIVKDDYSLGFTHKISDEGMEIVNSDAKFSNDVVLSTEIFYGVGTLSFMSAYVESKYVSFDDTTAYMIGKFRLMPVEDKISIPHAVVDSADITMKTKDNKLYVNTLVNDIKLYDSCFFEGEVCLRHEGFFGKGILKMNGMTIKSNSFVFKQNSFKADSACVVILDKEGGDNLIASNYLFSLDFDDDIGVFKSIDDSSSFIFPKNKVMCGLDNSKWKIGDESISMSSNYAEPVLPTEANVGLPNFETKDIDYNLTDNTLLAIGIESLQIADAMVSFSDGYLKIKEKASIESIGSATIQVGSSHTIYNAQIEINGDQYTAKGYYDYINFENHVMPFYFDEIYSDSLGVTHGFGKIKEEDNFMVNRDFMFKGDISFTSGVESLSFDGEFMFVNPCLTDSKWYKSAIDAASDVLVLSLNDSVSSNNCGLYYDERAKEFFVEFLTENPIYEPDKTILSSNDELYYDIKYQGFVNSEIFFKPDSCYIVAGQEEMDLGFNSKYMCFLTNGMLVYDISNDVINLEASALLDFTFNDRLVDYLVFSMFGYETKDFFDVKCKNEMCIIMDGLNMKWVNSLHCFVSEPEIFINSINNFVIADKYEAVVMMDYSNKPTFMFYLKIADDNWLFVKCLEGKTEVLTSDIYFKEALRNMNIKDRSHVDKNKRVLYEYAVGQDADLNDMLNKLKYLRGK